MSQEWYYSSKGERLGPVSAADLKKLAEAGNLLATDFVWKEGMADWVEAKNIKGLFGGKPSGEVAKPTEPAAEATPAAQAEPVADDPPAPTTDSRSSGSRPGAVIERFNREDESRSRQRRFSTDDEDDDRPRRRRDEDDEDDRPRSRGRRRDQEVDDYSPEDDYRDDFRPRKKNRGSKNVKPGKVTAIGIMMLIGGIFSCLVGGGLLLYVAFVGLVTMGLGLVCCFWPGMYFDLTIGILCIIRGSQILGQNAYLKPPPMVLSILLIIAIVDGNVTSCILGIICVVFCNDPEVKDYLAAK